MEEKLIEYILNNEKNFYRIAFTYVRNKDTAMDMVQNSILKALEQLHTLKNKHALRTWFYRILTNECLNELRKSKREIIQDPEMIKQSCSIEDIPLKDYELYDAIKTLPDATQTIIILHYYEELTLKEIAVIMECNENTVKSRLYSGLKKLSITMKEEIQ